MPEANYSYCLRNTATYECLYYGPEGRIRYDDAVTTAQVKRRAVVEIEAGPAAADLRALWARRRGGASR